MMLSFQTDWSGLTEDSDLTASESDPGVHYVQFCVHFWTHFWGIQICLIFTVIIPSEWQVWGFQHVYDMSRLMTKMTVRPAKTQISLGIHTVKTLIRLGIDAQADLSLRWPHEETMGP